MGNLGTLSITGVFQGKGPGGGNDLTVGDDLGQITILEEGTAYRVCRGQIVSATSDIQGIDIRNGIANSLIEAGYLINGGTRALAQIRGTSVRTELHPFRRSTRIWVKSRFSIRRFKLDMKFRT